MAVIGAVGLVVQQVFLRWNQGQELRQALITIAISVILADQVIAHFNDGIAVSLTLAGLDRPARRRSRSSGSTTRSRASSSSSSASWSACALWAWLHRTRTGMVIRAGVDDQQMTSALGVNIQLIFAIAFVVGSALAGFGGVIGASQGAVAAGQDGQWLLNSLVVVIIGGMGSLIGAAAGSMLYGLVFAFSAVYLPTTGNNCCTQYSIVVTFVLLAARARRPPAGAVRERGDDRSSPSRRRSA